MVVFLLIGGVGWEEEQVGLTADYIAPCPYRVCARLLGGKRLGAWEPEPLVLSFFPQACGSHSCLSPLWSPGAAPVL